MRACLFTHLLGPLLCSRHHAPASHRIACAADDGWRFTSVRAGDAPQSQPLPLLVEPFGPPLWVGEVRTLPSLDGERFELLRSTGGAPFIHSSGSQTFGGPVSSRGYTGALATEAICVRPRLLRPRFPFLPLFSALLPFAPSTLRARPHV
jgi:hypothetical protein